MTLIENEKKFLLRTKLLGCSATKQSQMNVAVTTGYLHSNTTQNAYMTILESNKTSEKQSESTQSKLILHYTHEERFSSFKRDIHHIYHTILHQTPTAEGRIIVGNRNRRDARRELIRKRPKPSILQNTKTTK